MPKDWTAEVVARLHMSKLTVKQLALKAGYTPEYASMVLNGHRDTKNARESLLAALAQLEAERTPPQPSPTAVA